MLRLFLATSNLPLDIWKRRKKGRRILMKVFVGKITTTNTRIHVNQKSRIAVPS